ncbi:hypothetical protein [Hymenobacter sp. HDW8]|nr:hypothetical protein [Hymenobacter sp. HDW8]
MEKSKPAGKPEKLKITRIQLELMKAALGGVCRGIVSFALNMFL